MAEGKGGSKGPGVPGGWESDSSPDDYRNFSSSGRGRTTADQAEDRQDGRRGWRARSAATRGRRLLEVAAE